MVANSINSKHYLPLLNRLTPNRRKIHKPMKNILLAPFHQSHLTYTKANEYMQAKADNTNNRNHKSRWVGNRYFTSTFSDWMENTSPILRHQPTCTHTFETRGWKSVKRWFSDQFGVLWIRSDMKLRIEPSGKFWRVPY